LYKTYLKENQKEITPSKVIFAKGCKVTLNFLPESNGKTIETVKKILVSSIPGYQNISGKTA